MVCQFLSEPDFEAISKHRAAVAVADPESDANFKYGIADSKSSLSNGPEVTMIDFTSSVRRLSAPENVFCNEGHKTQAISSQVSEREEKSEETSSPADRRFDRIQSFGDRFWKIQPIFENREKRRRNADFRGFGQGVVGLPSVAAKEVQQGNLGIDVGQRRPVELLVGGQEGIEGGKEDQRVFGHKQRLVEAGFEERPRGGSTVGRCKQSEGTEKNKQHTSLQVAAGVF
ncbi:hypothetical protein HK096_007946 [Nowakowskiella sp. JEL0078]|nr:hypothetical protein HK096_007946 [Nowakowskiella sp. JEL0078]